MSIKLTKTYTIRYIQGPNNYFVQSLRNFVDVDMDLEVRWRLDSGGRWVQSPRNWWARRFQLSRTLDQKSLQDYFTLHSCPSSRAGEQESVRRFPIFTALSCTPCISSVQFLYHLPVIKNFDLLHQNEDFTVSQSTTYYTTESDTQRRVSQYDKSTSPESRCGWIHDSGQVSQN